MNEFELVSSNPYSNRGEKWICPLIKGKQQAQATIFPLINATFLHWIFDLAPEALKKWYCEVAYIFRYIQYTFLGIFVNRSFILQNSFLALQELLNKVNSFITEFLQIPVKFPMYLVGWLNFDIAQGLISSVYLLAIPFISLLVGRKIYTTFFRRFI